jgi:hypothetical protein
MFMMQLGQFLIIFIIFYHFIYCFCIDKFFKIKKLYEKKKRRKKLFQEKDLFSE